MIHSDEKMLYHQMPNYQLLCLYEHFNVSNFCATLCDGSDSAACVMGTGEIARKATNSLLRFRVVHAEGCM